MATENADVTKQRTPGNETEFTVILEKVYVQHVCVHMCSMCVCRVYVQHVCVYMCIMCVCICTACVCVYVQHVCSMCAAHVQRVCICACVCMCIYAP